MRGKSWGVLCDWPTRDGKKTSPFYLSQERWGRVCLHFVAALRAGHWGWHLAGIGREIDCVWLQSRPGGYWKEVLNREPQV